MIRTLTIGNISTDDLGIYVTEGNHGTPAPLIITESIPYRDGSYDFSRADGSLHYGDRTMQYSFAVRGMTAEETQDRISEVLTWLNSGGEIRDEYISGWLYDNARCTSVSVEYLSEDRRVAKIAATFTASPWLISEYGYDPTIEPPKSLTSTVLFSSAEYSDDGKTAVMAYQISGGSMVRRSGIAGVSVSASSPVKTAGTAGGYFYAVTEQDTIVLTYKSDTVNIKTMVESVPSAFRLTVYPAKYGRARRL